MSFILNHHYKIAGKRNQIFKKSESDKSLPMDGIIRSLVSCLRMSCRFTVYFFQRLPPNNSLLHDAMTYWYSRPTESQTITSTGQVWYQIEALEEIYLVFPDMHH